MLCFAGPGAWSKEQQQSVRGVLAREHREWAGQAGGGTGGLGAHGLDCVVVTLPMSQPLMSWLKELAAMNTAAAQTMRRQEHNCCV